MPNVINVYINGTKDRNNIKEDLTIANILQEITQKDEEQSSYCLEGCGIQPDPRDFNGAFTFNLEAQVDDLLSDIRPKILEAKNLTTLNLFGFSRGGAAVFSICQKLKDIPDTKLAINLCALEPVPGNFVTTAYVDNISGFKTTLAAQIADLSDCKNIKNALILFTNEPIPDESCLFFTNKYMRDDACHAPILPIMPSNTKVVVDVLPGCHNNIQFFSLENNKLRALNNYSNLALWSVTRFFDNFGSRFDLNKFDYRIYPLELLQEENKKINQKTRHMHFYNQIDSTPGKKYLNLLHQELDTKTAENNHISRNCALTLKTRSPEPSYWNGQKSNSYLPTFVKTTAAVGMSIQMYQSPTAGCQNLALGAAAIAAYSYKSTPTKKAKIT